MGIVATPGGYLLRLLDDLLTPCAGTHKEWSLITGGGGGGASEGLPLQKGGGAEKVLALLKVLR